MNEERQKKSAPARGLKRANIQSELREFEEMRQRQALDRAKRWNDLHCRLDQLLDQVHEAIPLKEMGKDPELHFTLVAAANRCQLLSHAERTQHIEAIRRLAQIFSDAARSPELELVVEHVCFGSQAAASAIADCIQALRLLIELELAQARSRPSARRPGGLELKLLQSLLSSPISLDASAIAKQIGSNREPVMAKGVHDAISRLRSECGFEVPRGSAGYWLPEHDRELARNLGLEVEVVELDS